jgi:hypothetical protein
LGRLSASVSGNEESFKSCHEGIADAKALLAHICQDIERMTDQRSLITATQNTERAGQRKTTTLRYGSPFSFVDDQYVRLLFHGQLNGFPFTGIKGGQQFGIGRGM